MKCTINFNHNIMDYDFCATINMTSEEYELLNRAYQEYREEAQSDYLGIRAICKWFEEKNDSDMAERFLELMDRLYWRTHCSYWYAGGNRSWHLYRYDCAYCQPCVG